MFPGIYDPGFYVPQYLCSRFLGSPIPSPSPTHFIPQCLYVLLLLSCTFGLILIFHGLYNVSRSLCSQRRAYLCSISQCFVLSLFFTFINLYIRCFVLSLFRSISISLFHTPVVSHFMVSSIRTSPLFADTYFPRSYGPRSLCSPIPMFPVLCSPILRLHGPNYVPRSLCSPLPMFPNTYIIPGSYVLRSLCSPVPMFPNPYVPLPYVPQYYNFTVLCSPVPMFPNPYVPRSLCSPALCSPIL